MGTSGLIVNDFLHPLYYTPDIMYFVRMAIRNYDRNKILSSEKEDPID